MTRNIKLSQIDDFFEDQIEKLLRATVLEADKSVKLASPVDTGRFRESWQVGENASESTPAPPGNYGNVLPEMKAYNYVAGQEKVGNRYSVHNNLPYAEVLAQGGSPQAPAGWIEVIGKRLKSYVRSEYERIKRTS